MIDRQEMLGCSHDEVVGLAHHGGHSPDDDPGVDDGLATRHGSPALLRRVTEALYHQRHHRIPLLDTRDRKSQTGNSMWSGKKHNRKFSK